MAHKTRVLLVTSTAVDLAAIRDNPRYVGYSFSALAALEPLDSDGDFSRTLLDKIRRAAPSILIAHTGLAFERHPRRMLEALLNVRHRHPGMRLGLDRPPEELIRRLAGTDVELAGLIEKNRQVLNGDEEIAWLAECLPR